MTRVDPDSLADRQRSIGRHELDRYSADSPDRLGERAEVDDSIQALID